MNKSAELDADPEYWRAKNPSYWRMSTLGHWIAKEIQADRITLLKSAGDEMLSGLYPHERKSAVRNIKLGLHAGRPDIIYKRRRAIMGLD